MKIIGCDFHPSYQQIALVDTETGELQELRLEGRKLAVKMYWMLRENRPYSPPPVAQMQGRPSHSVVAG